jgi:hypothetical protein
MNKIGVMDFPFSSIEDFNTKLHCVIFLLQNNGFIIEI